MDSEHRNKKAKHDVVIPSEEDQGEITRTQSHDFITQLCINLESENLPPQATVLPDRPTMTEKSNHCWNKLHLREISLNPTVSNKCKQMNLFRDFHVQQFDTQKQIGEICISDRNVFMKSDFSKSVLIFDRETNRVIRTLNLTERIFCERFCYNEHDDSLVMINIALDGENLLETVPIESFYQQEVVRLRTHLQEDIRKSCFDFDTPSCKGIFYKLAERQFKVFELKNYNILYTIQCELFPGDLEGPRVRGFHRSENSTIALYHRGIAPELHLVLHSKENGHFISNVTISPIHSPLSFVTICSDTVLLLQEDSHQMVSVEISSPSHPQLRKTKVMAVREPIVVPKNKQVVVPISVVPSQYQIMTFNGMFLSKISERVHGEIPCLSQNLFIVACEDMRKIGLPERRGAMCIKVYDIVTAEYLGGIYADDPNVCDPQERRNRRKALSMLYDINYDPKTLQIFTITFGRNKLGIWSNK